VAVKVLESPEAQRHLARFRQEFEKLRHAGQHPNIIRCFEWGNPIIGGREYPWYSMEFALGGDLAGRIEERRAECGADLPWDRPALRAEVVREFRAIAGAVACLHGLGIVHRDIKPGNVLIMDNGELRLTDFGLVKDLSPAAQTLFIPRTSTGAVLGTRHYMAPEQERGEEVEKPADVYALGVLLAELTTGARPVPHSHVPQGSTLEACAALRRLAAPLRRFILRCTDVSPERRPADAKVMLGEFEPAAGDPG
jgi:serine/threonine-protein kinase